MRRFDKHVTPIIATLPLALYGMVFVVVVVDFVANTHWVWISPF